MRATVPTPGAIEAKMGANASTAPSSPPIIRQYPRSAPQTPPLVPQSMWWMPFSRSARACRRSSV